MSKGTLIKIDNEGKQTQFRCESPGGPSVTEIQEALGGYFALLNCVFQGKERIAYVDEDGDPRQLSPNLYATRMVQEYYAKAGRQLSISRIGMVRGALVVWVPDDPKPGRAAAYAELLAARKLPA